MGRHLEAAILVSTNHRRGFLAVASLAVLALPTQLAGAAGGPVVTNCNASGSGSLRQAVADAESGETVSIDNLTSCGNIT